MNERGGRYPAEEMRPRDPQSEARSRAAFYRRKKRRRRRQRRMLLAAALAFVLIVVGVFLLTGRKDKLCGAWLLDGRTTYTFDGNGSGELDVTAAKYGYTYEIRKDQLLIDFTEENLHDCAYTFAVEGDILTLVGGEGTVGGTYELHRQPE